MVTAKARLISRYLGAASLCAFLIAPDLATAQQPAPQQQQQPARLQAVPLDQGVLDRWLVLFADVSPKLAANPDLAEDKVRGIFDVGCRKAQFNDINQCHAIDDYLGVLISGLSEDGKTFADPVARARQDLAALNADRKIPAKQKAEQKAEIENFLASLPERIPPEHIALLNRNLRRVTAVLDQLQGPAGGPQGQQPPPGPPPGPAPKR